MDEQQQVYDPAVADGRFQLEVVGLRWALVALYGLFVGIGWINVDMVWFAASEGFLIGFNVYFSWYVWRELGPRPLPPKTAYANPFLDTVSISLALIAVGDPLHPIWAVYFFVIVGVSFFYYPIAKIYCLWLIACYALVALGLYIRGADVPLPLMAVAGTILLLGSINLGTYTGGERRLRGRISEAARTDPLTGLLNRRGLEEVLRPATDDGEPRTRAFAVFMLDIDRFKLVNDQYGHLAADRILEHLADVLRGAVRHPELVARFGGDEFVVIVPDVSPEDSLQLAERLRDQVSRFGLCTVSVGVTFWEGLEPDTKSILDEADVALLEAKQAGRNCVRATGLLITHAA